MKQLTRIFSMLSGVLVGVTSVGCQPQRDGLHELLPSNLYPRQIADVRLGTTRDELVRLRPNVTDVPYVGMSEMLGKDTVHYIFGRNSHTDHDAWSVLPLPRRLSGGDRIAGIEVISLLSPEQLRNARETALRSLGTEATECYTYRHGPADVVAVVRRTDDAVAGRLLYSQQSFKHVGGTLEYPPMMRTFVAVNEDVVIPPSLHRLRVACAQLVAS
jgi:hypothetical protein